MISGNRIVVAASDTLASELGEETVILNLANGVYYGLNAVAQSVWEYLREPRQVTELCRYIIEQYDVDPADAERDLLILLKELERHGLIALRESPIVA